MTPDETLNAFFAAAAPPSRDLVFQATVARRIARRRAIATVLALIPGTVATMVLGWAVAPMVEPVLDGLGQTLAPAAAILGLTALAVLVCTAAERRLRPT